MSGLPFRCCSLLERDPTIRVIIYSFDGSFAYLFCPLLCERIGESLHNTKSNENLAGAGAKRRWKNNAKSPQNNTMSKCHFLTGGQAVLWLSFFTVWKIDAPWFDHQLVIVSVFSTLVIAIKLRRCDDKNFEYCPVRHQMSWKLEQQQKRAIVHHTFRNHHQTNCPQLSVLFFCTRHQNQTQIK